MKNIVSAVVIVALGSSAALFAKDSPAPDETPSAWAGGRGRITQTEAKQPVLGLPPSAEALDRAVFDKQQPSQAMLAAMSTEELVAELAKSPLATTLLISRTSLAPDGGLDMFAKRHRGVALLLKRPDAAATIIAWYPRLTDVLDAGGRQAAPYGGLVLDALLGAEELAVGTTREEERAAIKAMLDSLDARLGAREPEEYAVNGMMQVISTAITAKKLLWLQIDARYNAWFVAWTANHPESHAADNAPLTLAEAAALLKVLRPELNVPTEVAGPAQKLPGQNDSKLADSTLMADSLGGAAQQTQAAWMRWRVATGAAEGDIPEQFWMPRIKMLKPLRVYRHRVNVVVAQKNEGGVESGKYIYIMISSYFPMGPVDGFEFKSLGDSVYEYTRRQ